jgi:glycosyltransferase involved in cell wall biosynthesis
MKIGFDAKRAFLNRSGLGNYSRFVLETLSEYYAGNSYYLFTPGEKPDLFSVAQLRNAEVIKPQKTKDKLFSSYWRTKTVIHDINKLGIDLYHGLSGEIPFPLFRSKIKSIVTIHDLIFLRYPELYKPIDRRIYRTKFKKACENADKIIAISHQTKNDIVDFFKIREEKIEVIYQGCHKRFQRSFTHEERKSITQKYDLPSEYILYVGTIEERKNLFTVVEALHKGKLNVPLVIVGRETGYTKKVKSYINQYKLSDIYFLKQVMNEDLPAIYQLAKVFVYPSVFEGFGIPILEALYSKTPVVTTREGCFAEAGGPGSLYIDPQNYEELAFNILRLLEDESFRLKTIETGIQYAMNFDHKVLSLQLNSLYNSVCHE